MSYDRYTLCGITWDYKCKILLVKWSGTKLMVLITLKVKQVVQGSPTVHTCRNSLSLCGSTLLSCTFDSAAWIHACTDSTSRLYSKRMVRARLASWCSSSILATRLSASNSRLDNWWKYYNILERLKLLTTNVSFQWYVRIYTIYWIMCKEYNVNKKYIQLYLVILPDWRYLGVMIDLQWRSDSWSCW